MFQSWASSSEEFQDLEEGAAELLIFRALRREEQEKKIVGTLLDGLWV